MSRDAITHFLILGAGASYGARENERDTNLPPPLGKDLAAYLETWLRANAMSAVGPQRDDFTRASHDLFDEPFYSGFLRFLIAAKAEQGNTTETGFEKEMKKEVNKCLSGTDDDWLTRLPRINRAVAQAMLLGDECAFQERRDLYDDLLDEVSLPDVRLAVVSFNYDRLFEEAAARRLGVADTEQALEYRGLRNRIPSRSDMLPIFKPHGSIDWLPAQGGVFSYGSPDPSRTIVPVDGSYDREGQLIGLDLGREFPCGCRETLIATLRHDEDASPILAMYSAGKPVPQNAAGIERVRKQCRAALYAAPNAAVTAIGIRPPNPPETDDVFLEQLFDATKNCSGKKRYINPLAEECKKAERYGFVRVQKTLREFLYG